MNNKRKVAPTINPEQIVYGVHPIIELLKAKNRKILRLYTTDPAPKAFAHIKTLLPTNYPVDISFVSKQHLAHLAGTTENQSLVAVAAPFVYRKQFFNPEKSPFLLMLDGIQDVRNLGAILRSAYCTGVDGVIVTQRHGAPINGATVKASAGLAEHMAIYQANSPLQAAQMLKEAGYNLYITNFKGENAARIAYQKPLCLVIGSEDTGVSSSIFKYGTQVTIPQRSHDISFNASVAAGIMLFLAAQER